MQKLRDQHRAAREALDAAKLEAAGDMAARQKAAQDALRKAQVDEGLAKTFQDGLKKQAIGGAAQASGVARQVLHGGVWVCFCPWMHTTT